MTHQYSLAGTLTRDGVPITDMDEISVIVGHLISAAIPYENSGFEFVDVDANATSSEGYVSLNWSDYGLDQENLAEGLAERRRNHEAARREAEERRAAAHG